MLLGILFCNNIIANSINLNIYLNTNQCTNCNIALNALRKLSDEVVKSVYFLESNKAASEELMEDYSSLKSLRLRYFSKELNPFKSANTLSYCVLFDGSSKIDSFELKNLFAKVESINALVRIKNPNLVLKSKIPIPDSIKLSDRLKVFVYKQHFSICDYLLNKNVTLTFNENFSQINNVLQIKGSAFKPYPFLKSGIVDTTLYRMKYADIKYVGKTKPEINSSYLTDSLMYLFLTFPCVIKVNKDTGIGGKFFLYSKNLFTRKSELFAIQEDQLPSFLNEEYFISNISPFYVESGKVFFSLYQENLKKENHFLAEYTGSGNRITFKSLVNHKISDSTYLNTDFGNTQIFLSECNSSFYFATYQPLVINTKTNVRYNFEKILDKGFEHNLLIRDVSNIDKDLIRLLIKANNMEKCLVYDTKKKSLVSETVIKPLLNVNMESLKFIDGNTLIAFDTENKNILIFKMD